MARRRTKRPLLIRKLRVISLRALKILALVILLGPPLAMLIFAVLPAPATSLMLVRLIQGQGLVRVTRPLAEISPALIRAVIASEDTRFCLHHGFDWKEIEKANAENAEGERLRGASTISMQTAKNLLLWPGRDWLRKGLEAYTTFFMEALWPKRRILETYLNIVEWGPGIYGAEAAARYHFSKTAGTLSAEEAAKLAVILPNPRQWRAAPAGPFVQARARVIETRMRAIAAQGLTRCLTG